MVAFEILYFLTSVLTEKLQMSNRRSLLRRRRRWNSRRRLTRSCRVTRKSAGAVLGLRGLVCMLLQVVSADYAKYE